ncbi:MAG: DUF1156 domain-containing protein [Blastocatellales bacterium]|nr:DUF1156 domain-containing protein [Nitrospira sp.]MCW5968030.1 DUF1156 domain-containing protein [Blastocatellales bacterium]
MTAPKRLIEVDLPIKRISAHSRREKSIRHGHISTLHIWWARRPLAACRAVICAALWPDPADPQCPESFRREAKKLMRKWANEYLGLVGAESYNNFIKIQRNPKLLDDPKVVRGALFDFIADFANWDNSTKPEYLETSRALTESAHVALGGEPGTRPLVVDPFAGGGAIPLEALRIGADAFASDLNPVAVLLNKVVLEYIPKYGQRLADEVRKWGEWVKREAEKELAEFYPKDPDGATPIAYLWARTIVCEGPGCGVEVPLMRSLWLSKKPGRGIALQLVPRPRAKRVDFEIIEKAKARDVSEGTVRRGSASCPVCSFTTPVASVRKQMRGKRGGASDAQLFCVVTTRPGEQGRFYRLPTERDRNAVGRAQAELEKRIRRHKEALSLVPDEPLPPQGTLGFRVQLYGMEEWGDLFTPRQLLALTTLARLVRNVHLEMTDELVRNARKNTNKDAQHRFGNDSMEADIVEIASAVQSCLGLVVDRQADALTSLVRWRYTVEAHAGTFGRQALPMMWDFTEIFPFSGATGDFQGALDWVVEVIVENSAIPADGTVAQTPATSHPLPDDSAVAFITDPPYYDAVPYADLSDFFYVWLKRTLTSAIAGAFAVQLTPKEDESIVDEVKGKDRVYFERTMAQAMAEGRRVLNPTGVGLVVFAHKSTSGWEAQLQAMVNAGWTMTGSWPIDTERPGRLRAQDSAALASSVHLVCRPRENPDVSLRSDDIGDWRDVLQELPKRIHEWMPRLASEGVVGADAIFACLGPALEIFSRYSRVEKASGDQVTLKEYLEHVWAAVSKEALNMIFKSADATGFEEDARLTAMWLWTLSTGGGADESGESDEIDDKESSGSGKTSSGYTLEFDAARKIAQGLGAHLEQLDHVVAVKGDQARLLPVSERAKHLFGKAEKTEQKVRPRQNRQRDLFDAGKSSDEESESWNLRGGWKVGETTLDRVHQSMLLFGSGRGEAMKRFLVEDGAGREQRFWRLAQALSALYPANSEEKRWVDGVLARKKGLGF